MCIAKDLVLVKIKGDLYYKMSLLFSYMASVSTSSVWLNPSLICLTLSQRVFITFSPLCKNYISSHAYFSAGGQTVSSSIECVNDECTK